MPISWMAVLQGVPWGEVIANAPKVAEAAKKLWTGVSGRPGKTGDAESALPGDGANSPAARVATLEATVADLHAQMLASSELIQALAEQNTQLIARVELSRRRMVKLAWALGIVTAVMLAGVAALWVRIGG